jgi:hypothetical protein
MLHMATKILAIRVPADQSSRITYLVYNPEQVLQTICESEYKETNEYSSAFIPGHVIRNNLCTLRTKTGRSDVIEISGCSIGLCIQTLTWTNERASS